MAVGYSSLLGLIRLCLIGGCGLFHFILGCACIAFAIGFYLSFACVGCVIGYIFPGSFPVLVGLKLATISLLYWLLLINEGNHSKNKIKISLVAIDSHTS
eukprot:TRINITY_DN32033_c0_g2_i1.p2 TRINITY_DN32033_c0_g2~~TRINITY_DN32033_c0_g2_i1.p2  ORF type:complete len:100 (+),score=6.92 TRINITY_DN32033_c0_g2_i1:281-580(+)